MIKHAIILAAGMGSRLNFKKPKGFLNIYGYPLISYSIKALLDRGIQPIIGTGYCSHYYDSLGFTTVRNADYETTGSLWTLKDIPVSGDVLILESDILYDPSLLDAVINHPEPNVILTGDGPPDDAVFVETKNGYLTKMSKELPAKSEIVVGITKMSGDTFSRLVKLAAVILRRNPLEHYDYVYELLPDKFWVLKGEGLFTEIDDQKQLEYAINYVFPRL